MSQRRISGSADLIFYEGGQVTVLARQGVLLELAARCLEQFPSLELFLAVVKKNCPVAHQPGPLSFLSKKDEFL